MSLRLHFSTLSTFSLQKEVLDQYPASTTNIENVAPRASTPTYGSTARLRIVKSIFRHRNSLHWAWTIRAVPCLLVRLRLSFRLRGCLQQHEIDPRRVSSSRDSPEDS